MKRTINDIIVPIKINTNVPVNEIHICVPRKLRKKGIIQQMTNRKIKAVINIWMVHLPIAIAVVLNIK